MTNQPNTGHGRHNIQAAGVMFAAVIAMSLFPVVIIRSGGIEAPFSFNSAWRLGSAFGSLLFLLVFYRSVLLNREVLSLAGRNAGSWTLLAAVPTSFDYALFSAATGFLDASISAVLFEVWPIILILLASFLLRRSRTELSGTVGAAVRLRLRFQGRLTVVAH